MSTDTSQIYYVMISGYSDVYNPPDWKEIFRVDLVSEKAEFVHRNLQTRPIDLEVYKTANYWNYFYPFDGKMSFSVESKRSKWKIDILTQEELFIEVL